MMSSQETEKNITDSKISTTQRQESSSNMRKKLTTALAGQPAFVELQQVLWVPVSKITPLFMTTRRNPKPKLFMILLLILILLPRFLQAKKSDEVSLAFLRMALTARSR